MHKAKLTPTGRRWLLRLAIISFAGVAIATTLWTCWYYHALRTCDRAIAAMRARGEQVSWREVTLEEVPDDQNAAWYLRQAHSAFTASPASTAYPITNLAAVHREIAANAAALDLLHKARACQQVSWGTQRDSMGFPPIPNLMNASNLAKTLRAKILLLHTRGEDREAIECWRDGEAASRTIGTKSWTLISSLVSLITNTINTDALAEIAPDLRIDGPNGLERNIVRALIAELSDESIREIVARGFLGERTGMTTAYLDRQLDGTILLRPAIYLSVHKGWGIMDAAAQHIRDYRPMPPVTLNAADRLLGIIPQFTNAGTDVHNCILRRRLAAMVLAVRLYHAERHAYPRELDDLFPSYLPRPPMDTRAADTRPLGYLLAENGTRPVVYSAGASAASDNDLLKQLPAAPATVAGVKNWSGAQVIFIDASAPRRPIPSTQAIDDQVEQPDNPGKHHPQ